MMKTPLTKPINGDQLQAEMGASDLYVIGDDLYAEGVTQKQLEDGLAAHTPDPNYGLSADQKRKKELGAKPSLTNQETVEAIKLYLKGV